MEGQATDWEEICAKDPCAKELPKIYKELLKVNNKKTIQLKTGPNNNVIPYSPIRTVTRGILRQCKCSVCYHTGHVLIHLSTPIVCPTPSMSPKENCGLWAKMVCQWRLIHCKNVSLRDVGMGEAMCAGRGVVGKSLSLSLSFSVNLKL